MKDQFNNKPLVSIIMNCYNGESFLKESIESIINQSYKELNQSVDMFQYSNFLNSTMDYQDKVDLIRCIFEVGYSDGELHYLENHYIKTISNMLNIERKDLIKAKLDIKKYI